MALEGAYSFDTDGTDYSGNGRTLILSGTNGVITAGGHTGSALGKNGATMPVFPGSLLTATQSDDRCVMFWATGNLTTWWVRWEKDAIGSGTWGVLNISGSMAIQARRASDDSLLTRPTGTQPGATPHHYAATYTRSTGVCRLLVDGVQTGTQSFTAGTQLTTNADRINIAEWSTTGPAIDDLRFFSHVPTDPEISAYMNTPVTAPAPAIPIFTISPYGGFH
ncbi:hypothetical protein ABZ342_44510 [Amycolatopsis sp. NPDC005961]|uniref:LamG-like jellyroll fold domain-containing protein n=1 Tax=Amycolatopsis sp. NPDC005961 TaxID=3156720 RepID=UPI0033C47EF7